MVALKHAEHQIGVMTEGCMPHPGCIFPFSAIAGRFPCASCHFVDKRVSIVRSAEAAACHRSLDEVADAEFVAVILRRDQHGPRSVESGRQKIHLSFRRGVKFVIEGIDSSGLNPGAIGKSLAIHTACTPPSAYRMIAFQYPFDDARVGAQLHIVLHARSPMSGGESPFA